MKGILLFVLGLLAGFLGVETFSAPRRPPATRPARPVAGDRAAQSRDVAPDQAPAADPIPVPALLDPAMLLARARPASQLPGAYYLAAPSLLYYLPVNPATGAPLSPEETERFREYVRTALENDLLVQRYLLLMEPARFSQFLAVVADQIVEGRLRKASGSELLPVRDEISNTIATRLAGVFSAEEMEAIAELPESSGTKAFRGIVEAFASHGLPQPTREQLDALIAPTVERGADGQWYRTRSFDPSAAPASLNAQQRAYLDNVARWRNARFIVSNLHSTTVRDPEVWEIWPD